LHSGDASPRSAQRHSHSKHHRHLSSNHLIPPTPVSDTHAHPIRRTHSHSHAHNADRYRAPSPPPKQLGVPHRHDLQDPYRRRAVSMHFDHGLTGGLYQIPSVASHSDDGLYDDGASIAGSAMTFMDGPVGGQTSQYGLPQYAHVMRPDPRRWVHAVWGCRH